MKLEFTFSCMVNASPPLAGDVCFETSVIFIMLRYSFSPCDVWQMLAFKANSFVIIRLFLPRVAVGCRRLSL